MRSARSGKARAGGEDMRQSIATHVRRGQSAHFSWLVRSATERRMDGDSLRESRRARRLTDPRVSGRRASKSWCRRARGRATVERFVERHREWIEKQARRRRCATGRRRSLFRRRRIEFAGDRRALARARRRRHGAACAIEVRGAPGCCSSTRRPAQHAARVAHGAARLALKRAARSVLAPRAASAAPRAWRDLIAASPSAGSARAGEVARSRGTISLNCCLLFQRPEVRATTSSCTSSRTSGT